MNEAKAAKCLRVFQLERPRKREGEAMEAGRVGSESGCPCEPVVRLPRADGGRG